jgi:hypothetical protein
VACGVVGEQTAGEDGEIKEIGAIHGDLGLSTKMIINLYNNSEINPLKVLGNKNSLSHWLTLLR